MRSCNWFVANTVGLFLEGANRNRIEGNTFEANGWGLRVLVDAADNRISDNAFLRNSFDVGTQLAPELQHLHRGLRGSLPRLDRDGFGDVSHAPVRLFALVVEQTPPAPTALQAHRDRGLRGASDAGAHAADPRGRKATHETGMR